MNNLQKAVEQVIGEKQFSMSSRDGKVLSVKTDKESFDMEALQPKIEKELKKIEKEEKKATKLKAIKDKAGENILKKLGAKDKLEAYEVQLMFLANAVETLADIVESQKAPTAKQTKALEAARMMKKAIVDELNAIK